jgi:thioredoxin 1
MKTAKRCALVDNEHGLEDTLKANKQVIALFYASWCPFCSEFLPIFERCAEEKRLSFLVVKDDDETIGDRYSVEVVPTVLLFERGNVSKRLDGVRGVGLNEKMLTDFIHACSS